jgi:hypothetical protein
MSDNNKRINAAYRLLEILGQAVAHQPQQSQIQVWISVFRLQDVQGRTQKRLVMQGIELIHEQLDRIVAQLHNMGHQENTYHELVNIIDNVVSYEYLGHQWRDQQERLQRVIYPLTIINSFLPDEEQLINLAEFDDIEEELSDLENSLNEKDISHEVRNFVQRQIEIIRKAMWQYRFRGIRAFQESALKAATDFIDNETVAKHADDLQMQRIRHLWRKVASVITSAGKMGGSLAGIYKLYELVEKTGLHHVK